MNTCINSKPYCIAEQIESCLCFLNGNESMYLLMYCGKNRTCVSAASLSFQIGTNVKTDEKVMIL